MLAYTFTSVAIAILFFVNRSHHAAIHENTMASTPLTCHVLDTGRGVPAEGLQTSLHKLVGGNWSKIAEQKTNKDGRLGQLVNATEFTNGIYKMYFDTKSYYQDLKIKTFYPYVEIVFEIENPNEHYHVPLLLAPYGYTTYRGS